ncbi:MAG: AfsR/SARP family transcriptional regulator, partial [Anaerolineales bacterium]
MNLRLLGPFEAWANGDEIGPFRSEKERALLAYLAVQSDIPHQRQRLAALLWPESSESAARRNLRITLHRIRTTLEGVDLSSDFLQASRTHIKAEAAGFRLDVHRFQELLEPCTHPDTQDGGLCPLCQAKREKACHLYAGHFLDQLQLAGCRQFMEWVITTRERLQRQALSAMYELAERKSRRGELSSARALAERQLELAPWREAAHRQLMELLARGGEQTAALEQYKSCRRMLQRHLSIEPAESTRRLAQRIRRIRQNLEPHLPKPATPLIGREDDLNQLKRMMAQPSCRLISITGLSGLGKTRLAIELARQLRPAHLDGVYFLNFDSVRRGDSFWSQLIHVFGLNEGSNIDPERRVHDHLKTLQCLLVLDSFESCLSEADGLARLLATCPSLTLLVTSQEPLRLKQEHRYQLSGLRYQENGSPGPSKPSPAAQMFISVLEQRLPDHTYAHAEIETIEAICRHLAGWPWGIELAAASFPDRSLSQIRVALEDDPESFGPLTGGPERQRTLGSLYAHACAKLTEDQRQLLERLSVFSSPFQIEAACRVTGAGRADLAALRRHSLLQQHSNEALSLHNSLRALGRSQLESRGELDEARQAHAQHYLGLLENSWHALHSSKQQQALETLDLAWNNLLLAWSYAVEARSAELLSDACLSLARYCSLRGRSRTGRGLLAEAVESLQRIPREVPEPTEDLRRLHLAHGETLIGLGQFEAAEESLAAAAESTDPEITALAQCSQSRTAMRLGRNQEAIDFAQQAQAYFRRQDHGWGLAQALHQLAMAHWEHSALDAVEQAQQRAHEAAKAAGDPRLIE